MIASTATAHVAGGTILLGTRTATATACLPS